MEKGILFLIETMLKLVYLALLETKNHPKPKNVAENIIY